MPVTEVLWWMCGARGRAERCPAQSLSKLRHSLQPSLGHLNFPTARITMARTHRPPHTSRWHSRPDGSQRASHCVFHAQEPRQDQHVALPASQRLCFDSVQHAKLRRRTFGLRLGIQSCRVRTLIHSRVSRRRFSGGTGGASMDLRRAGTAARRIASGPQRVDRLGRWHFPGHRYAPGRFESDLAGRADGTRKRAVGKWVARPFLDRTLPRFRAGIREHRRNRQLQS
jgi:hypothetical protein